MKVMDDYVINLICKVVDGTATPEEQKVMNDLKEKDSEVQAEFDTQEKVAETFGFVGLQELDDSLRKQFISGVYNKLDRKTAWILSIIGITFVFGYGLYEFMTEPDICSVYRIGIAGLIIGFGLLFSSVLRVHVKLRKHDKYKGVIR